MGIETNNRNACATFATRLNGLGSPMGIETLLSPRARRRSRLNGLGSPMGIETSSTAWMPIAARQG